MRRETEFNYGLLLVGIAVPVLADYFLGKTWGVILAIILGVIAVALLVAGHTHRDESEKPLSRVKKMAAFIFIGVVVALGVIGLRAVFTREFSAKNSDGRDVAQKPSLPTLTLPTQTPTPPIKTPKSNGEAGKVIAPPPDNSVHIGNRAKVEQQSSGDCSPNIIGGSNTVNCGPPKPPPPHVSVCVSPSRNANGVTETIVTLTTDSKIDGPAYELFFDKPLLHSSSASSPDMAMNEGEGVDDRQQGFAFQLKQEWFPGSRINLVIRSISEVRLINTLGQHEEIFAVSQGGCNSGL